MDDEDEDALFMEEANIRQEVQEEDARRRAQSGAIGPTPGSSWMHAASPIPASVSAAEATDDVQTPRKRQQQRASLSGSHRRQRQRVTSREEDMSDDDDDDLNLGQDYDYNDFENFEEAEEASTYPQQGQYQYQSYASSTVGQDPMEDSPAENYLSGMRRVYEQQLADVPGWSPGIMGEGLQSKPTLFSPGLKGSFVQQQDGLWMNNDAPLPVRVLAMQIPLDFFARDAMTLSEFDTPKDPVALSRSVSFAALLGLLTTGTSKRMLAGDTHVEIEHLRMQNLEADKIGKEKTKIDGHLEKYSYLPFKNEQVDMQKKSVEAMQFCFVIEELYSPRSPPDPSSTSSSSLESSHRVGLRVMKLVFDPGHSDDLLQTKLIKENSNIARAGAG